MGRKLFCELSPAAYRISVFKESAKRSARDAFGGERFAKERSDKPLETLIYRHNSLIRRVLGNTQPELQENKAVNLAIAAPILNGILLRPGEVFSFWRLVGRPSASRGFREGLMISNGKSIAGTGGGMCQMTNLIHWMVLHTPLTVYEHHHHDGFDLFPDYNRQVPFGVGTSIAYNYVDYRVKNETDRTFQLRISLTDTHLCGELRADAPLEVKYHIAAEGERFVREGADVFRCGEVYRTAVDKRTGNVIGRELIRKNHAKVLYDTSSLDVAEECRKNL